MRADRSRDDRDVDLDRRTYPRTAEKKMHLPRQPFNSNPKIENGFIKIRGTALRAFTMGYIQYARIY